MDMPVAAASIGTEALTANRFFSLLRKSVSANTVYIAIVGAYYTAFCILLRFYPDMWVTNMLLAFGGFLTVSVIFITLSVFIMRFYHIARYVKPERPIPALLKDMKQYLVNRKRVANGLPIVLIMMVCMYVFSNIKSSIPMLNPYSWDVYFADLDKAMHFGRHPWEWLQPLLGYAPITYFLNLNYNLWFLVTWMVWVYFAFLDKPSELRTRFFLSFFALWIVVGSLLAVGLSSVGPCFYSRIGLAPDPFAGLMTYLHSANEVFPIWALALQDELWQGYIDKSLIVKGISAMPSMHNGSALLYVLAGYQVSRFAGRLLAVHCLLVFIGSIHLGWHYAVDSYLAWAITLVIWFAVLPIARWWHSTAAQREFDRALAVDA
jgi:PAP2 superfamily